MRSARRAIALLLASTAVACGGDDLVLPEDGVPTSIVPVSGNNQSGTVRSELPNPITVQVLDVQSRPVRGQEVTFTVITGGGSVEPVTVITNDDGEATIEWTLGGAAGTQQVRAQATGGAAPDDLSILLTATAGASNASSIEMVSGNEQTATAGSALNDSLIVRAEDAEGNPVEGVTVAWTVTGGGSLSQPSTVTGADGQTGIRWTLGPAAGAQSALATVAGLSGSPVTFTATAVVGSAGRLVVAQQPSPTAVSGVAFSTQPRVQVQDINGNNVSVNGIAITAELVSGPPGSSLQGNPTVATNGGLATFTNLAIVGPAGSYTLNFTGADLTGITSSPVTLTIGSAAQLAFTTQPTSTTAGAAITPPVQVTIQDAQGQRVSTATNAVTISLSSNPAAATLGGTLTVNAVNGIATFSNLTLNRAGTGYALRATASGLTAATSSSFNVAAGGASTLTAVNSVPATTTVGSAVTPAPSVKLTDAGGNPVSGVTVTFATVGGGSVSGASQTTDAQGIATVGGWTIGSTVGTIYGLSATAAGVSGTVLFQTEAVAGSAAKLAMVTQPSATAQSGEPLAPQPVIQVADAAGNPVAQAGITVTASLASGDGTLTGTTSVETNTSGRAVFSNLVITGTTGSYSLLFQASGLSSVTSNAITLTAGSVSSSQSSVTAEPASLAAGNATTLTVTLRDASGNAIQGATISLSSDAAGTFGETTLTSGSGGTATTTYTPTTSGSHTITASAGGAAATTTITVSEPVTEASIPSAAGSSLTTTTASIRRGESARFDLFVGDASSNPVEGIRVAFVSDKDGVFDPREATTSATGSASTIYRPNANGSHLIRAQTGTLTLASATLSVTGSSSSNDGE
jgi:hypothetical protein